MLTFEVVSTCHIRAPAVELRTPLFSGFRSYFRFNVCIWNVYFYVLNAVDLFLLSLYFQAVTVARKGEVKGNQGKLLDWIILGFGKIFYQITGGGENDLMSTPTSSVWGLFYIFCDVLKYFLVDQGFKARTKCEHILCQNSVVLVNNGPVVTFCHVNTELCKNVSNITFEYLKIF